MKRQFPNNLENSQTDFNKNGKRPKERQGKTPTEIDAQLETNNQKRRGEETVETKVRKGATRDNLTDTGKKERKS